MMRFWDFFPLGFVFFLFLFNLCSALITSGPERPDLISADVRPDVISANQSLVEVEAMPMNLSVELVAQCLPYAERAESILLDLPTSCCHFSTEECHYKHNGYCRRKWDSGHCDYTIDACSSFGHNWHCTCCASCDGPNAQNDCKSNGGNCRRYCNEDEYWNWWHKCSNDNCKCCKKRCQQTTCANGRGRCVHNAKKCPRGYYTNGELCEGLGCRCCVRCSHDHSCRSRKGYCEGYEHKCPFGYKEDPCYCKERDCRCCRPSWIPNDHSDELQSPIKIKTSNQMEISFSQNGKPVVQEKGMEKEEEEEDYDDEEAMREQEEMAKEAEEMEQQDSG